MPGTNVCSAVACAIVLLASSAAALAQPAPLVILTTTGQVRDGLPVVEPHPNADRFSRALARGFSGKLVRLYALEQAFRQRRAGTAPEPAYLVLSDRQGGFPQFGFYLGDTRKTGAGWVDLHRNSPLSGRFGAVDQIFPHELFHVIARQLAGEPRESGGNQIHAIGVRTDPVNAFSEGAAEAMQIFAVDDPDALEETRRLSTDTAVADRAERAFSAYARDLATTWWPVQPSRMRFMLWFNQSEQVLRYHGVKANRFARTPIVPESLLLRHDKYPAYLFNNVVPGAANGRVKSAAEMLSSEGVVSHLMWRLLSDEALQRRHVSSDTYEPFGTTPAEVTPAENVFLKVFVALYEGRPATMAEFLRSYARKFPADAADLDRVVRDALAGQALPDAPEIWLANDALTTGTSLFDQYRALPRSHTFDANAATAFDWIGVPGVSAAEADRLAAGAPYTSMDALEAAASAPLRERIRMMSASMARLRARAASEEQTLSLSSILVSYAWRLAALLLAATSIGALLARKAGARRWGSAALIALGASLLVVAFAWIVTSPPAYPFAAPLVAGGLPWTLWRIFRRQPMWLAAQPMLVWTVAAVPALIFTLV